jgi:hypothetical protein
LAKSVLEDLLRSGIEEDKAEHLRLRLKEIDAELAKSQRSQEK